MRIREEYASRVRRERLPVAYRTKSGQWDFSGCNNYDDFITCEVYGQMSNGDLVWADDQGNQYLRVKFYGKYFFVKIAE